MRRTTRAAPKYDIFLSYCRKDSEWVLNLKAKLEANFLRVWMDQSKLEPGDSWQQKIREGIDSTQACIFCVGRHSSKWFLRELEYAEILAYKRDDLQMFAILLPGANEENLPGFLITRQHGDFRDTGDDPTKYEQALKTIIDGVAANGLLLLFSLPPGLRLSRNRCGYRQRWRP